MHLGAPLLDIRCISIVNLLTREQRGRDIVAQSPYFYWADRPFSVPGEHHDFCLESTYTEAFGKAAVLNCFDGFLCSLPNDVGIITFTEGFKVVYKSLYITGNAIY